MDAREMKEEERIAEKQAAQNERAAILAEEAVAAEGGVDVTEYEEAASRNHGL